MTTFSAWHYLALIVTGRPPLEKGLNQRKVFKLPNTSTCGSGVNGASSDEDMYMGIISVPMVDSDPVEPGAEVPFRVRHQFSRKRSQVRQILRVFRRNDEPEVVAVIAASFSKAPFIRPIRTCVEHFGVSAITGDPVSFEIG